MTRNGFGRIGWARSGSAEAKIKKVFGAFAEAEPGELIRNGYETLDRMIGNQLLKQKVSPTQYVPLWPMRRHVEAMFHFYRRASAV